MFRWTWVLVVGLVGGTVSAQAQAPIRISGVTMAGQIETRVNPVYPAEAKAAGVSGAVVLRAVIGKDGTTEQVEVVSGPEMLRASSLAAVKQWTYRPYLMNGEATTVETAITINYTIPKPPPTIADGDDDGSDLPPMPPAGPFPSGGPAVPGSARIAGGVMAGMIVKKAAPSYPAEAKAKGISGTVVMRAIIGKDGAISNLSVISGPEELRKSALKAVSQWRYRPYKLNGQPTEVDTTITVNYNIGY